MKFHISDVLSITTGRLVSIRHIEGVYDILGYMTGDSLMTHQLPRAGRECAPVLLSWYPQLSTEDPATKQAIEAMDAEIKTSGPAAAVANMVLRVRLAHGLEEELEVPKLAHEQSSHTDPLEELIGMVGRERVIVVSEESA